MSTEIVTRLKALKLHGMASNWPELVAHCRHAALEPEQLIEQLLDAEGAERNVRSIAYQMTAAGFPAHRDLATSTSRPARSMRRWCASCTRRSSRTTATSSRPATSPGALSTAAQPSRRHVPDPLSARKETPRPRRYPQTQAPSGSLQEWVSIERAARVSSV